jgi:hypothetical protein
MDEATAREIIKVSIRGMALFDQLMETLRTRLPLQEYEIQKRRIAGVMTEISVELMSPIYRDQPSTEPVDVDAWTSAGQLHEPKWLSDPVQLTAFTTRS